MYDDFKLVKSEYEKYGSEAGEGVASAMYEALVRKLAPYYFSKDEAYKRRVLSKLEGGELYVGTRKAFDWTDALDRYKPKDS